jgi:hypothetical protein
VAVSLLKPPKGGFRIETATILTATYSTGHHPMDASKCPFGCNGNVTTVAVGQSQRLYSGVRIFTGNYLSSPPQIPLHPEAPLES